MRPTRAVHPIRSAPRRDRRAHRSVADSPRAHPASSATAVSAIATAELGRRTFATGIGPETTERPLFPYVASVT